MTVAIGNVFTVAGRAGTVGGRAIAGNGRPKGGKGGCSGRYGDESRVTRPRRVRVFSSHPVGLGEPLKDFDHV